MVVVVVVVVAVAATAAAVVVVVVVVVVVTPIFSKRFRRVCLMCLLPKLIERTILGLHIAKGLRKEWAA